MAGAGVTISVRVDGVDTADGPANSTRDGHHRPADVPRPPDVPSYARPRQNVRRTNCNVRRTGGPIPHATATPVRRTFRVRRTFPLAFFLFTPILQQIPSTSHRKLHICPIPSFLNRAKLIMISSTLHK